MTPAAPTASWRKVCEEHFARLVEDLEQHVDSEVESRVSTAIEAALRGAVTDAVAGSRRALAEELNQGIRRLRRSFTRVTVVVSIRNGTSPNTPA